MSHRRSAYVEAISHLTEGLDLLNTLPDAPERSQLELTLQIAKSVPLITTKGYGVPEVAHACARARELCRQVGETPQLFPGLRGLSVFYIARAKLQTARELAEQGQRTEGMAQMRQGLAVFHAIGVEAGKPYFLALLAKAYGRGQAEEGLSVLDEALAAVQKTGERWWEAKLYRLKGELVLAASAEDYAEAEAYFQHAIAIARRQQAKSLELRAAMSLSRLWQQQGKSDAARGLLAPVYGWFTEGFDTADLQGGQGTAGGAILT